MNYFKDQSNLAGLYDLGFSGPKFTWRRGQLWERLDRIFVNSMWLNEFIHNSVQHLSMTGSDHRPLLMKISASNVKHKTSFRYLNMWSSHKDFFNQVSLVWRDCHTSNPLIKLWKLQKKLGRHLSNWNWKIVGDINLNVVEAEKSVANLEAELEINPDVEKDLLIANKNLMNAICMQEDFFAQKAAKTRFCEGDRNSKYFHAWIKFRRKWNTIHKIKETDGKWLHSKDLIATNAVKYYQILFKQPSALRPSIQQELFCRDENFMWGLDLTSVPGEEEIWSALASIYSPKVAGPDGFSADFYKKSWKIIKDDIIKVVQGFFRGLDVPNYFKCCNITLIPKSSSAIPWDLFKPINLTNVISKMISKVISNRLQPLLPKLICENQSAFIKGRSIVENFYLPKNWCWIWTSNAEGGT
ncbi:uncharacterized protein LOC110038052 [Phalaenopsis equestris]|uniref:uncharacterized protein LOC110038052 n=1 Tax=Phalaenopsis equestris TaxID=78828 RepID=UPI0009E53CB1|nr:uncharacterized protein LOC110038052 [Phalaenopsis equestris]